MECSLAMPHESAEEVNLVLRVSRDPDQRLSGTVRVSEDSETYAFSGTLELMGVFERLVPRRQTRESSGAAPGRS